MKYLSTLIFASFSISNLQYLDVVTFLLTDFQFALAPPSMLAAACISSALAGIMGSTWCEEKELSEHLHNITDTDRVRYTTIFSRRPL